MWILYHHASGLSQTMREHVTQPTLMARGRVAHVIAWKGWERPGGGRPATPEGQAYSELSATEQAALFAAGVAEQFAIAEARLRAWSSLDDASDESTDVSRSATPSTGQSMPLSFLRCFWGTHCKPKEQQGPFQKRVFHSSFFPTSGINSHTLFNPTLPSRSSKQLFTTISYLPPSKSMIFSRPVNPPQTHLLQIPCFPSVSHCSTILFSPCTPAPSLSVPQIS
uniref:Uncharacterized protein n=1 Tax=Eptatretus burgeri TaxID=7764 RepID=A0A8C4QUU8_EPTBU